MEGVEDAGVEDRLTGEVGEVEGALDGQGHFDVDASAVQGAGDEGAYAVADEGGDDIEGEGGQGEMGAHEVDGGGEVGARVGQGAVEVENEQLRFHGRRGYTIESHGGDWFRRVG